MNSVFIKCDNCGNEFELTKTQLSRYLKNPEKHNFCSKSCSAIYNSKIGVFKNRKQCNHDDKGRFIKNNSDITMGVCYNCGKKFDLTKTQKARVIKEENPKLFCSKSCSAKYSNSHRSDEWKEQVKKTSLFKYGEEHYVNKAQISESVKKLYKERNDYGFSSDTYKQTMLNKYGVENIGKSKWIIEHNLKTYGTEFYFQSEEYKQNMEKLFNSPNDYYARVSKFNNKILELLKNKGLNCGVEKYIRPYYYDIVFDNTVIEINPTITHNTVFNIFNKLPITETYHLDKLITARNAGYRCIHIFDWDNIYAVIDLVSPKKSVYGRKCEIKEISSDIANEFICNYHIQGVCKGNIYNLGLYYKDELVEVMTFGKSRYNKHYEWELLRLCSKTEYKIIGGASKLFNYFIKLVKPKSIVSYCDLSKFNGDVYVNLGFTLYNISKPAKHWYNMKTKRHITDNLLRQRGYSQLHNDKYYNLYNKGQSNEKLMLENGYVTVYDCGQATYVYREE